MPKDDDESELTPAQTPDAKKSSGAWKFKFNEPDALCGRTTCSHRRDEHESADGGYRCMLCDCARFVVGGLSSDEQRADTEREMAAVTDEKNKT
jgi:hypothetical protein